ncbi:hypothetical protein FHU10_3094 [Serratia fonticola]|jgi:hypothetical protein|uniref:Uncharacterized protein n=1 Tax=Serratia fonticola TaxID=47917 RepID=A0A542BTQ3_SERFO|nr:hypothetical protein FHU09_4614 [Serratia fonticola]TQI96022.1 hypothetical protein FHU11_1433 [Serratia fonticola]TVZ70519.1 hypothetical protein FHU10_3094 [Serratia fonticola]
MKNHATIILFPNLTQVLLAVSKYSVIFNQNS